MTVDPTHLTSAWDEIDRTAYTTASISPTALRWLVVDTYNRDDAASAGIPTVSGLSLTWIQEHSRQSAGTAHRVSRFYAWTGASPGSGTITLDWGAAQMDGVAWIVYELGPDVDTSDPFVQSASTNTEAGATSITVTLSAFADGNNRPLICASHRANEASTPEAGYTEVGDVNGANPIVGFACAYHAGTTDTTPSYSWTTSASNPMLAIASEIKAAAAVTGVADPFGMAGFYGG